MDTADASNDFIALVNDRDVLTLGGGADPVTLPTIATWPDTEDIAAACGVSAVMRVAPALKLASPATVLHVVTSADQTSLADGTWTPIDELASAGGPPEAVDSIVDALAAHAGTGPFPARRPAWFRQGWAAEVDAWIDGCLDDAGLRRSGPTEHGRMWSLSAVSRVPVAGPTGESSVWCKATCDWFRAEPAITQVLGSFADGLVPGVIAVDREKAWMLMEPFPTHDAGGPQAGIAAAAALADVQIRSLEHLSDLAAAGCADRTLERTLDAFHGLVVGSVELESLSDEERELATKIEPWIGEQLAQLDACGIPNALVHGDLHLGNVAWDATRVVLFDWTDACLSHPFVDGPRLARSAEDDLRDAIRGTYVAPWRAAFPHADIDRAWDLAVLGDAVFQAISYEAIYAAQEDASRWEMAGVVAGTLRSLAEQWRSSTSS